MRNVSRRSVLKGAAIGAAGAMLGRDGLSRVHAQTVEPTRAVVLLFTLGGYNALFGSADSFLSKGSFGVTSSNIRPLGNGVFVDEPTFGQKLPPVALSHFAQVGINHRLTSHIPAQVADWSDGQRNYALQLAAAIPSDAAIRCAVVGTRTPRGPRQPEGVVSMQQVADVSSTLTALGTNTGNADEPGREMASVGLLAARDMSARHLARNPRALATAVPAYETSAKMFSGPPQQFDYAAMAAAYGVTTTSTGVTSFPMQMLAAELMVRAGCKVVIVLDDSWDTHGDLNGSIARNRMGQRILPAVSPFLSRMMADPGFDVTFGIFGDFARSLPGSDHAPSLSATVIGKRMKVGTTGRVSESVRLPDGAPSVLGFWSLLADAAQAPVNPFGPNPHASLLHPL